MFNAIIGFAIMGAVVAAYSLAARRYRVLWHPLSILMAVITVSVVVAVAGEVLRGSGLAGVLVMSRRSAIGGLGWGLLIAGIVWAGRRGYHEWIARRLNANGHD
jgi:hypothetical protein